MRHKLVFSPEFTRKVSKLKKKDNFFVSRISKALKQISKDPFYKGLKTHKVGTRNYGVKYSSNVTRNIRIIWEFSDNNTIILLLTIGGHSGKSKVHK